MPYATPTATEAMLQDVRGSIANVTGVAAERILVSGYGGVRPSFTIEAGAPLLYIRAVSVRSIGRDYAKVVDDADVVFGQREATVELMAVGVAGEAVDILETYRTKRLLPALTSADAARGMVVRTVGDVDDITDPASPERATAQTTLTVGYQVTSTQANAQTVGTVNATLSSTSTPPVTVAATASEPDE